MSIDAAKGRWLSNISWIIIIIFVVGIAMQSQSYIDDVKAATKHVNSYPQKKAYYDQIITEQKVLNTATKKDLEYIKTTLNEIKNELIRLKLVSIEDEPYPNLNHG